MHSQKLMHTHTYTYIHQLCMKTKMCMLMSTYMCLHNKSCMLVSIFVCVCVCVCVCYKKMRMLVRTYMCVYVKTYSATQTCMWKPCARVCIACTRTCTHLHVSTWMALSPIMHVYMCICKHMCNAHTCANMCTNNMCKVLSWLAIKTPFAHTNKNQNHVEIKTNI